MSAITAQEVKDALSAAGYTEAEPSAGRPGYRVTNPYDSSPLYVFSDLSALPLTDRAPGDNTHMEQRYLRVLVAAGFQAKRDEDEIGLLVSKEA